MPILKPTIIDAFHRRRPLVVMDMAMIRPGDMRTRLKLAEEQIKPHPVTRVEVYRGIGYAVLSLPVIILLGFLPAYLSFTLKAPPAVMIIATLPMALVPALIAGWMSRRIAAERVARGYLFAGFCASCGYDLKDIDPDDRNITMCPECGSAWRAECIYQIKAQIKASAAE